MRKVYITGGAITPFIGNGSPHFIHKKHPDFGKKQNPTWKQLLKAAVDDTFAVCGLSDVRQVESLVDKTYVGNFCGECFINQGHMGPGLTGIHPGLNSKPSMRVEGACASGALAVNAARDAILAGKDVCLVAGVEVQTTVPARIGGDYLARASDYERQRSIDDFTFPAILARRMKACVAAGHCSMEDVAHVAVKAYQNGNKNPLAHMTKSKVSLEHALGGEKNPCFLGNEEFKNFLRLTDCSQVSDGAAAVILASEEGLAKMGRKKEDCVEILAMEIACGNLFADPVDPTRMDTCAAAAKRALANANVTADQLQVAEVHDCFTIAEVLMYEALGIAKYGEGRTFAKNGVTALTGRIPVNTGGGLLAFGHPVGATGVKQVLELYRQMKGKCGEYQMKNVPTLGAALNMGGDDKTGVCTVVKNCI